MGLRVVDPLQCGENAGREYNGSLKGTTLVPDTETGSVKLQDSEGRIFELKGEFNVISDPQALRNPELYTQKNGYVYDPAGRPVTVEHEETGAKGSAPADQFKLECTPIPMS